MESGYKYRKEVIPGHRGILHSSGISHQLDTEPFQKKRGTRIKRAGVPDLGMVKIEFLPDAFYQIKRYCYHADGRRLNRNFPKITIFGI